MARYCPASNNQPPFHNDPTPEEFTLKDLTRYMDAIPVGLSELTDEGPVPMVREAYSWRTDMPRVFIARSADGKGAALAEFNGEALSETALTAYLTRYSAYITGADVRAMGRTGAVVMDIMLRQFYPDDGIPGRNLLGWNTALRENSIVDIQLAPSDVPVRRGARRIQFRMTIPGHRELFNTAEPLLGDWPIWEAMARTFPRTVAAGEIPLGVACYRPKDGVSLKNGGMWVPVAQASTYFSRTDIVCVTTPQGHAVLMCLDTQSGIANCEPGDEYLQPAMQWLLKELPDDLIVAQARKRNLYGMLYGHLAAKLINDNLGVRGRSAWSGMAGASNHYPRISHDSGSFFPMVLDAVFVPPETSVHDILSGGVFDAEVPAH